MQTIPEKELTAFLSAIESGAITLTPDGEPQEIYAANVRYTASNGWRIVVFNDANEWDYIDALEDPKGNIIEHVDLTSGTRASLFEYDYRPSEQVSWQRYRIPGYMKYRCVRCGAILDVQSRERPFLCGQCAVNPK